MPPQNYAAQGGPQRPPPSPRYATACRLPAPLSISGQNPKICAMVKSMFNFLSLEYSEIYFPPGLIEVGAKKMFIHNFRVVIFSLTKFSFQVSGTEENLANLIQKR